MSIRMSKRVAAMGAVVPLTAALALAGASPALASQPVDGSHKVAYCHATHSAKNPYVYIETDKVAVIRAHEKHQNDEDIIPAFTYVWDGDTVVFPGQNQENQDGYVIRDGTCEKSDGGVG
ncbi:hypothetical protein [Microbacterium sp. C7(2022)]|uniref:hypothetical protein n=1 Tax=Microbacterium sp. C7(2022) TaxID=2992759 RepID=UPI00237B7CE6|nr:hypothetical protein [Microbacterium sp. C7(2022)]MDE0545047.1 hypothetical protein [Microbacterium sp. C7(2022)]